MSNNITYLMGAGASADAIPPVDGMKESMMIMIKNLNQYIPPNIHDQGFSTFPFKLQSEIKSIKQIVEDFIWLLKEGEHHITFDTLAWRFYVTGDNISLNRLKRAHIVYFTIIQICSLAHPSISSTLIDKRYDGLIAHISERNKESFRLIGNVKVLTWNYDLQMELSLKRYVGQKIHEIKENFRIYPNHNSLELSTEDLIIQSQFAMVKLNGNAFFDNPSDTGEKLRTTLFDQFFKSKDRAAFLGELAFQYKWLLVNNNKLINEALRYFNFSWESDKEFHGKYIGYGNNLDAAIKIASATEILVVIGYSFPEFNRKVDKILLESMENLRKVYIQDLDPGKIHFTLLKNFPVFKRPVFIGNSEIEFQLEGKDSLRQFLIPSEI